MKKYISLMLAIILAFTFCACGSNAKNDGNSQISKNSDLKIEDISWTVEEGIKDGDRVLFVSITNNSSYVIKGFEITFKQKATATEEQVNAFFDKIKTDNEYDDEDMQEMRTEANNQISMHLENGVVINPGMSDSSGRLYYFSGIYYCNDSASYAFVEPDIATIEYVDGDLIKTVYYDFASKKYTKDLETETAYEWGTTALKDAVPKPETSIVEVLSDSETCFSFDAYGITKEYYMEYVNKCKELGYSKPTTSIDNMYCADGSDGKSLYISYDEENQDISVRVSVDTEN